MPYATDIRNSRLVKDKQLMSYINEMLDLDLGEEKVIPFENKRDMLRMERRIRVILDGMGRKEDFKLGRRNNYLLVIDTRSNEEGINNKEEDKQ